jgi:hypothetical protein
MERWKVASTAITKKQAEVQHMAVAVTDFKHEGNLFLELHLMPANLVPWAPHKHSETLHAL